MPRSGLGQAWPTGVSSRWSCTCPPPSTHRAVPTRARAVPVPTRSVDAAEMVSWPALEGVGARRRRSGCPPRAARTPGRGVGESRSVSSRDPHRLHQVIEGELADGVGVGRVPLAGGGHHIGVRAGWSGMRDQWWRTPGRDRTRSARRNPDRKGSGRAMTLRAANRATTSSMADSALATTDWCSNTYSLQ